MAMVAALLLNNSIESIESLSTRTFDTVFAVIYQVNPEN
jgi:hypothetical protein